MQKLTDEYLQEIVDYRALHTKEITRNHFQISEYRLDKLLAEAKARDILPAKTSEEDEAQLLVKMVSLYEQAGGNKSKGAKLAGVAVTTFKDRLDRAKEKGLFSDTDEMAIHLTNLEQENKRLLSELRSVQSSETTVKQIRHKIFGLTEHTASPPNWVIETEKLTGTPGIPTLFLSDFHWGEKVESGEVNESNSYGLEIAHRRLQTLASKATDLLKNHMIRPDYPGIVLAVGGDMFSGDIHEELSATNEVEIMQAFADLFDKMIWFINTMADEFGRVFVPWVAGNHSRLTRKPRMKGYNYTNFDFLLGLQLEKYFEKDKRIQFYIPNSRDAVFRIYNHTYVLTHGDQFRGGDGQIGALGPIVRGDLKKRSRNNQINVPYDTLLVAHWHTLVQMRKVIMNGSLKGYDEYAYSKNLEYEPPQQALWITHPEYGVTFHMPVFVDAVNEGGRQTEWVSWAT